MATASHSTFPFLKFSQLEIIYTNDNEPKQTIYYVGHDNNSDKCL